MSGKQDESEIRPEGGWPIGDADGPGLKEVGRGTTSAPQFPKQDVAKEHPAGVGAIDDGPGLKEVGRGTTSDWSQFPNQDPELSGCAATSPQSSISSFGAVPALAGARAASQPPRDEALAAQASQAG